ncbi:hypothetical protein PGO14_11205 [Klebsiella aerogenes]
MVFPAALRLAGLLVVGPVVFPAALRLDGLLVAGPVVFPAALRLAGLLVVRLAGWVARVRHLCRPRESLQGPYAKKARTFVRALISNMAVRGSAIFTFIIIRVNHNYFFIYNVLSLLFVRWRIAIFRKSVILCSTG